MPTLSRRTMILTGVGVAGVAAVGVTAGVSLWPRESTIEADAAAGVDLVRSRFAPLVGTEFTASATVGVFSLTLDSVEEVQPVRARKAIRHRDEVQEQIERAGQQEPRSVVALIRDRRVQGDRPEPGQPCRILSVDDDRVQVWHLLTLSRLRAARTRSTPPS